MDGTDPAGWDPKLDGLIAAPANHLLLYEDESHPRAVCEHHAGTNGAAPSPSLALGIRHRQVGKKMRNFDSDGREHSASNP